MLAGAYGGGTVPEPSTLFVEGIFSWDRWHWDCWRGVVWVFRGFIPVLATATVFFRAVFGWPIPVSLAAAALSVPAALTLSVAWEVLYMTIRQ